MAAPIHKLTTKYGLDPKSLKKAFDSTKLLADKGMPTAKLVNSISNVIREGIERNRQDYRLYKAMDWAYDTPFYQVSYTQLRGLINSNPDDKKVMQALNSWGLTHLLPTVMKDGKECCNADGSPMKALNVPVFFNIFVPIVMAYIGIRWAKLSNDLNLTPHFKFDPVQFTKENRIRCEVVTQAIQKQTAWFDYPADTRQTILQTLIYGYCINFPREAWFVEKQETEEGEEKIIREGLRFNIPHPSRVYYDLYHRLSTLNSNSGCKYAGYWELCRYGEIYDNPLYWNKDKITLGSLDWFDLGKSDFLEQVYPCTMKFPDRGTESGPAGALDRESAAARFYNHGDYNASTLITQHFQHIIPAEHGLGKYENPVFMRFVFASDSTVLWAEPLAYDVLPTYAYDPDFNRSRFRSLALEIIPFQDHISNLLTNWIAATKENLQNPIFYDAEKIPKEFMDQLENRGSKLYGSRVYVPFNGTQNYRAKIDQREAFHSPQITRHNTSELATLISGVLGMLDRIMQLSPQEIGQAASHEQSAGEVKIIAQNTSTRVTFTSSFIEAGNHAKKKMLYDALMAYADDGITVGITSSWADSEAEFKKLIDKVGLTIADDSSYDAKNPDKVHQMTAKKSAMQLEEFSSVRESRDRVDNPQIADAMSKVFTAVANNPMIVQSIGAPQLVELLNQIIQVSGLPKEFKLRGMNVKPEGANPEEQGAQFQQMIQQFAEQVKQLVAQSQQETLAAAGQQTQQLVGEAVAGIAQQIQPLIQAVQETSAATQANSEQIAVLGTAVEALNAKIEEALAPPPPMPVADPALAPLPI